MKLAALTAVILLSTSCGALANGPEVVTSGAVLVPVASSSVQLVAERVHVALPVPHLFGGQVEVEYQLQNTVDDTVDLSMAFVTGRAVPHAVFASEVFFDSRFRVLADGRELATRQQAVDAEDWVSLVSEPPESLRVWELLMAPVARETLEISYVTWPHGVGDWESLSCDFTYYAKPASLWKGQVAEAELVFTLGDLDGPSLEHLLTGDDSVIAEIAPPGYTWSNDGLKWSFTDWEPDGEFRVSMHVVDADGFRERLAAERHD